MNSLSPEQIKEKHWIYKGYKTCGGGWCETCTLLSEIDRLKETLRKILEVYEPYNIHGFCGPKVIKIVKEVIKED